MTAAARWRREDLAYCSNVHPGEDLTTLQEVVRGPVAAVRRHRGLGRMAAGLWLPAAAAHQLDQSPRDLDRFREALDAAGLRLVTLNGFPFGDFHGERVKHAVYRPDWSSPERLAYTLALARVLTACAPKDAAQLTISTLPVAQRDALDTAAEERALENLCTLARELGALAGETGPRVRVCLEPEPGCFLERAEEAAELLGHRLPAAAAARGTPESAVRDHLGVCYDVCHQAVQFEPVADGLATLQAEGVVVGKVQISSALRVPDPAHPDTRTALIRFHEPRYLHQVRWPDGTGIAGAWDLDQALREAPTDREWRVHFHLPIQAGGLDAPALATTRGTIDELVAALAADDGLRPHLEVETYTWWVLPAGLRPADADGLTEGLAGELQWFEARMAEAGLLEP